MEVQHTGGAFGILESLAINLLIVFTLYVFIHWLEILIRSLCHASQSLSRVMYTNKGTETSEMEPVTEIKPERAVSLSNLMDSGLDDIRVPILHPKQTRPIELSAEGVKGSGLLDGRLEDLMIPVLEPERKPAPVLPPRSNTALKRSFKMIVAPWDGKIRWAIKGCSVFENDEDELDSFMYRPNLITRQPIADLWVFQYGIRYIPAHGEGNVYRTIKLEGFPRGMSLNRILPAIPAEIYSARLFDTIHMTGSPTVIVVFVKQSDALKLLQTSRSGLLVGYTDKARVTLVHTPTYPMTAELQKQIFKEGYTRCLVVHGERDTIMQEVCRVLKKSIYADFVQSVEQGHVAGDVKIKFHGIKMATGAHELFKVHPSFRQYQVGLLSRDLE